MSRALNLSNSIYSQWNTKKTKPSKRTLPLIAEYLDTTVEYLIGQEDDLSGDEPDQDLYESILSLCQEKGIKGGKMCVDLGFNKSLMTDLKSGRKKGITSETAQKIADYFSVSVDRVLNGVNAQSMTMISSLPCLETQKLMTPSCRVYGSSRLSPRQTGTKKKKRRKKACDAIWSLLQNYII